MMPHRLCRYRFKLLSEAKRNEGRDNWVIVSDGSPANSSWLGVENGAQSALRSNPIFTRVPGLRAHNVRGVAPRTSSEYEWKFYPHGHLLNVTGK
jgi:hypothetical protein